MLLDKEEEIDDLANKNDVEESSDSDESIISASEEEKEELSTVRHKINPNKKQKRRNKGTYYIPEEGEFDNKPAPSFMAGDSLSELKENKKKLAKISLAERLKDEDLSVNSVKQHSFGSREMTYTVEKPSKFEKLRQKNKEHHLARKAVIRSSRELKGKLRMKDKL